MNTREIECRFLEIDKEKLVKKLLDLGAKDHGEEMIEEVIIYDALATWKTQNRILRLRKIGDVIKCTYKEHQSQTVDGAYEIEFEVSDYDKAELLFEKLGFVGYRHQQKKRHTLELHGATFDIDTWPKIPTYLEIEAESEQVLKDVVKTIGYDWNSAVFKDAAYIIEENYNIPVRALKWFTFDRVE